MVHLLTISTSPSHLVDKICLLSPSQRWTFETRTPPGPKASFLETSSPQPVRSEVDHVHCQCTMTKWNWVFILYFWRKLLADWKNYPFEQTWCFAIETANIFCKNQTCVPLRPCLVSIEKRRISSMISALSWRWNSTKLWLPIRDSDLNSSKK